MYKISPKTLAIVKSYLRAVLASAISTGLALAVNMKPEYAVLIGAIAAPLVKWADKAEKDFGRINKVATPSVKKAVAKKAAK